MADVQRYLIWGTAPPFYMVLLGIAGIAAWHLIPRHRANARLIVQIGFFLSMSALLLDGAVIPYEPARSNAPAFEAALVGLAKILWWVHLAWALIGFVRIYLVFENRPREARLLQDLVVGVVYVGVFLSVLAFVFGMPVGTLIATSGVFAIILGLALQNTLSDVFSGIALTLGRPYVLGNWIVLSDGTEGRVVETNWRSTHLLTLAHNVVVLPNSFLAKLGLTNISSPDESHGLSVTIRLAPTRTPAALIEVIQLALAGADAILKAPPPLVAVRSLDAVAIEFELSFRVASLDLRTPARNQVHDLVYRHMKSAGLLMAMPPSATISMAGMQMDQREAKPMTVVELIASMPLFSTLTEDEVGALAATATMRTYRQGDTIVLEGEALHSLMIVRDGVIARQRGGGGVHVEELGHLAPGDFFGETGLLAGMSESSTLRAASRVVVYELDQESFAPLLRDRPEMAEDIAAILSARTSTLDGGASMGQQRPSSTPALLRAIRAAFRVRRHGAGQIGHGANEGSDEHPMA